jgi:hypothetical protein
MGSVGSFSHGAQPLLLYEPGRILGPHSESSTSLGSDVNKFPVILVLYLLDFLGRKDLLEKSNAAHSQAPYLIQVA